MSCLCLHLQDFPKLTEKILNPVGFETFPHKYLTRDGAIVEVQRAVNDDAQCEGRFEGREGSRRVAGKYNGMLSLTSAYLYAPADDIRLT